MADFDYAGYFGVGRSRGQAPKRQTQRAQPQYQQNAVAQPQRQQPIQRAQTGRSYFNKPIKRAFYSKNNFEEALQQCASEGYVPIGKWFNKHKQYVVFGRLDPNARRSI